MDWKVAKGSNGAARSSAAPTGADYYNRKIMTLTEFPIVVDLPVQWGDMDSFGHVNNVVYFRYFEHACMAYLRRLSFDKGPREGGIGPILAATEARFRKPLTYPDEIQIGARLSEVSADRFTLEHRIVSRLRSAVVAEGKSLTVAFDYGATTKARLPVAVRAAMAGLEAQVGRVVKTSASDWRLGPDRGEDSGPARTGS